MINIFKGNYGNEINMKATYRNIVHFILNASMIRKFMIILLVFLFPLKTFSILIKKDYEQNIIKSKEYL